MNKRITKILLAIALFLGIILISTNVKAGDLNLKELDYNVTLSEDGSANVLETWKIEIEDTNTLFKDFETEIDKITDVKVYEVKEDGTVITFKDINEYKYHVDKDCYYGLIYKNKFEIAWGADAKHTTLTYKISYKINNAVKNYNDCSEFYWQFIGKKSEIPADIVTGKITLPKSVSNIEDLKIWAHGQLNGEIYKISNNVVEFKVENLKRKTILETRIVTPTQIFSSNTNIENTDKLQTILSEEKEWAEEANEQRNKAKRQDELSKIIWEILIIIDIIIGIIVAILIIYKIIKYRKILKETNKIEPIQKYDYYREIPNEKLTPAQTAFIYYYKNMQLHMPQIISATMLDLALKKYLKFEKIEDKKDELKITLRNSTRKNELQEDERIVFEMLESVSLVGRKTFTMKEFKKYLEENYKKVNEKLKEIEKSAKKLVEEKGYYDKQLAEKENKWEEKIIIYTLVTVFSFISPIITIPSIIALIYSCKIHDKYNTLTQEGENEKQKLLGLKRYMEDFSKMKEKTVPELVLWEKYLIYATIFGIADKVLKQLKVVYPQIAEQNGLATSNFVYMNLLYSSNMSKVLTNTLNTTIYSSGSGAGGGFSSGGGFGGGGGRNGRKISLLCSSVIKNNKRIAKM